MKLHYQFSYLLTLVVFLVLLIVFFSIPKQTHMFSLEFFVEDYFAGEEEFFREFNASKAPTVSIDSSERLFWNSELIDIEDLRSKINEYNSYDIGVSSMLAISLDLPPMTYRDVIRFRVSEKVRYQVVHRTLAEFKHSHRGFIVLADIDEFGSFEKARTVPTRAIGVGEQFVSRSDRNVVTH